jgi:hypothetical protein
MSAFSKPPSHDMRLPSTSLPALILFGLLCGAAPLQAQEPGFADSDTAVAPGFDSDAQPVATFDWDALAISNARLNLSESEDRKYVKSTHGIDLTDKDTLAYKGVFASSRSDGPQLLVIDLGKDELRLYEGSSVRARYKDLGLISSKEAASLDLPKRALVAQTTQEGTMELVLWRKTKTKGSTRYHMSVYKVIGSYFGTAFSQEVAVKSSKSNDITPTSQVNVFRNSSTKAISFGVSPQGKKEITKLYKWDRWSGTFANPEMLPKATKGGKS